MYKNNRIIKFITDNYGLLILFFIPCVVYLYVNYKVDSRKKHTKFTKGKIFRIGPCNRAGNCVEYEYTVDDITYKGSEDVTGEYVCSTDSCLKKEYVVAYDSLDPENSDILGIIEEDDFNLRSSEAPLR